MGHEVSEENESLLTLAASPLIWGAHFLLSYGTVAVFCAKVAGPHGSLAAARVAIGMFTFVALVAIVLVGWRGWKRHRFGDSALPHDHDSPGDRHRFLGFATALLSGLSGIAVGYEGLSVVFLEGCQ